MNNIVIRSVAQAVGFKNMIKAYERAGYKEIGQGSFAVILYNAESTDRVVKIGKMYDDVSKDAYLQYLLSMDQGNKHAPKVINDMIWVYTTAKGKMYYIVVLEKLEEYEEHDNTKALKKFDVDTISQIGCDFTASVTPKTKSAKAMDQLIRKLSNKFAHDVSPQNVMWRVCPVTDKKTLVIIDPVS